MKFDHARTRFAPSPTGYMHVGNLRTALYAYLISKSQGGKFLLRIEDTDQERLVEGATDIIYDTLRETGLIWDEGPDIGGPVAPYVQSERMKSGMYKKYALELVEKGAAYYCFCDKDRLEESRVLQKASGKAPMYDRHCLKLTPEEIKANLDAGMPYVIRQKIPEGETTFHDEIFGDITVDNSTLDDQILIKTDGMPTYNFANVIDDHEMGITHVVRGNEYLASSPKYNLLYEAFGWDIPKYIHCPPVMKDATNKLSKRNGDASYQDLVAKGYLTEAILNYILLLGWSPKGEEEFFTLEEMKDAFYIEGISKSSAIFDPQKLRYINAGYLHKMTVDQFHEKALPWIKKAVTKDYDTKFIAEVIQPRCEVLSEIPEQIDFLEELPEYSTELYVSKKMKTNQETSLFVLKELLPVLEKHNDYTMDGLHEMLFSEIEKMGVKNGYVLWPLRVAVSGKQFTPGGALEICTILGKEESLNRIRKSIELLENQQ